MCCSGPSYNDAEPATALGRHRFRIRCASIITLNAARNLFNGDKPSSLGRTNRCRSLTVRGLPVAVKMLDPCGNEPCCLQSVEFSFFPFRLGTIMQSYYSQTMSCFRGLVGLAWCLLGAEHDTGDSTCAARTACFCEHQKRQTVSQQGAWLP
ncbi:hypothetical protein BDV95DRAFT_561051 [Massariosphaeria phaeospora]|uniref:Uncharacterized protein n=1 Tax=Massariosphaeria phaeospora TaxID=100035 RepID=A0A7C8MBX7_9PLEO|nr:hypothetical protein BDV95DRAFT_561051 [Massariosphaeria phaeospora]